MLDAAARDLLADREHRVERAHRVLEDAGDLACRAAAAARRGEAPSRSRPWNVIAPERSALSGRRLRIDIAVTLLPEPDSPTRATVVFSGTSKLTPLTASTRLHDAVLACRGESDTRRSRDREQRHAGFAGAHSSPRSFGSSASRSASVMSENAVTKTAMKIGRRGQLPPVAEDQLALRLGEHRAPATPGRRRRRGRGTTGSPPT